MDTHALPRINDQIYEEACAWFVECRAADLDEGGRREFDRWLRKSPEHLSAYLEISAIWNEGPSLDAQCQWTADRLIQLALESTDSNVVSLTPGSALRIPSLFPVEEPPMTITPGSGVASAGNVSRGASVASSDRTRRWRRLSIAAAVLVVLGASITLMELSAPVYSAALGEQRSIQLKDGSTVELNSQSRVRVNYSKQERDVELLEGQALFHVAHDAARPFVVSVGSTHVRAVGTQFDVYKRAKGTVVTVVEGLVAVYSAPSDRRSGALGLAPGLPASLPKSSSPDLTSQRGHLPAAPASEVALRSGAAAPELTAASPGRSIESSLLLAAGEQLVVSAGVVRKSENPNIAGATAWREREIILESATLADVAEEFNRYNQRQLVVEDPELYGFHVSGVFSSTDPDALIKFLRQRPGVRVIETGREVRIERDAR